MHPEFRTDCKNTAPYNQKHTVISWAILVVYIHMFWSMTMFEILKYISKYLHLL